VSAIILHPDRIFWGNIYEAIKAKRSMLEISIALGTLCVSLAVLARSSEIVVDSISKLSRYFGISQLAIGFLLLAVATSLPELSVSLLSSVTGEGAIATGNIFGSNIANILLVVGASAFIYGVRIRGKILREIGLLLLLTTVISAYILFSSSVAGQALGFLEGAALLCIFGVYVWHGIGRKKKTNSVPSTPIKKEQALNSFVFFIGSIVLVLVSSSFVVESAVMISLELGVAESFIGATVIALGTSLPELSIGLQSVKKKKYGIFLGNAIGSNVVNLTLVLGVAATLNPIAVQIPVFIAALLFAVVANMLLLYVAAVNKRVGKIGGASFLAFYIIYLGTIFMLQLQELGI
jgi:cation:H+ antiporter